MNPAPLRWQAAAVARSVTNLRGFIERRASDKRWPESDIDKSRHHLAALEHAALTMQRLAEFSDDPEFSDLIKKIAE